MIDTNGKLCENFRIWDDEPSANFNLVFDGTLERFSVPPGKDRPPPCIEKKSGSVHST